MKETVQRVESSITFPRQLRIEELFDSVRVAKLTETCASNTYPGLLVYGDNLATMEALLPEYAGKIKLFYIDPPFCVGSSFAADLSIGNDTFRDRKSKLNVKAYDDRWRQGREELIKFMRPRIELIHQLLSEDGSLYLHCDYRTTAHFRLLLEEIFGEENYINECIWSYRTGGNCSKIGFGRKHDTIHFVAKDINRATWNIQKDKSYLSHHYGFKNVQILHDARGPFTEVKARDVWDIPALRGNQPERVEYPTQKPEALVEKLILASTNPGDIVVDVFSGSGTTAAVAERLNRAWIAADAGKLAIHTARKRLLLQGASFYLAHNSQAESSDPSATKLISKIKASFEFKQLGKLCVRLDHSPQINSLDGWALDLDWTPGSVFYPDWVDFRTRFDRKLNLTSAELPLQTPHKGFGVRLFQSDGEYTTISVTL